MTIAAGFLCSDGIVLCADTQMSHGGATDVGGFAHYESKVFGRFGKNFSVMACGAGNDGDLIKPVIENFFQELIKNEEGKKGLDFGSIKPVLEASLNMIARKLGQFPEMDLLTALSFNDKQCAMLKTHNLIVEVAQDKEILGIGDRSLIQYLVDGVYHPGLPLSVVVPLSAYVVWAAKKYCPQYCGGDTDIHIIPKASSLWFELGRDQIKKMESVFEGRGPRYLRSLVEEAAAIPGFLDALSAFA